MIPLFKTWWKCRSGNTGVLFGLAAIPLLVTTGSALDFVRLYNSDTELQSALDGAALAAASIPETDESLRVKVANEYFAKAAAGTVFAGKKPKIEILSGVVTASLNTEMPTSLMGVVGVDKMSISGMAEVSIANEGKVELALVLDYSGSMNAKQKYQSMRDAAIDMIDVLSEEYKGENFKVGLAPFSAMVYASLPSAYVNQTATGPTWIGCTQDRQYPYNTNIAVPNGSVETLWGYVDGGGENNGAYGCSAYANHGLLVSSLSSDVDSVKDKIMDMKPVGNTNIPLGAQFGWMLLDSKAPFTEGAPANAKNTGKFLVLLTDGVQTSSQFDSSGSRSVVAGENNLLTLCEGMRNDGITVFTIAYDITNPKVTNLLEACAPGRYFEPGASSSEISAVFEAITAQIKNEYSRLTR